ncbi:phosphatidate cytidylyltransferase [Gulosibacter sediminis]|uniref:phosphatidate cytidylyltransferase n=1 Tax=Gulosibacter sediminis TaxID=1729695 RepID=UPI0018674F3B|nr:phosphatidate cytidylyltransferase [Gulosibacter sediminis]
MPTTSSEHEDGRDAQQGATPPASRSLEIEAARIRRQVRRINDQVNERSGRNLLSAIGIAVVLIGAVLLSLLIDKRLFIPLGMAIAVLVVMEVTIAMRRVGRRVPRVPSAIVALATVPIAYFFPPSVFWVACLAGVMFVVGWRLVEAGIHRLQRGHIVTSKRQLAIDASSTAFVHFYVTFLSSFTVMLLSQPLGEFWVLSFIAVVVAVDTGGYAAGLQWGRTKLAPRISPGKTWEGIAGGVVLGTLVAIAACVLLLGLPWWFGIIMGVALTVTGVCGDLTESMIKRDLGVKDMSNWLPGHGGFFDRVDSMIPSGAMAFALYFWSTPLMEFAQRLG